MKLIDKQDRNKLREGRDYGMGFAFARLKDKNIELVMPLTCCKDFLAEPVSAEILKKSVSAYGLTSKPEGLFDCGRGYLVVGILPGLYREYANLNADKALMAKQYTKIATFLNWIEEALGMDQLTKAKKLEDNRYLYIVPGYWCSQCYLISLYTLLMRVALYWKGDDHLKYLENVNNEDAAMVRAALPKLKRLFAGERPIQDLTKVPKAHDAGIVNFAF